MTREYHGYGPDGYKPSPYHGTRSNLDWADRAAANYACRVERSEARIERKRSERREREAR